MFLYVPRETFLLQPRVALRNALYQRSVISKNHAHFGSTYTKTGMISKNKLIKQTFNNCTVHKAYYGFNCVSQKGIVVEPAEHGSFCPPCSKPITGGEVVE